MESVSHSELVRYYDDAESQHKELFAEQRSNLMLVAGLHYNKKGSKFWRSINKTAVSRKQKLRLTKNHVQKISKTYQNNILAFAPGVAISPKNDEELSDQKAAEMHSSVWQDIKYRHKFKRKRRQFVQDLVDIGECAAKVTFDENEGEFLGYEEALDEYGEQIIGEDGRPEYDAVFTGDMVYERILGFNLLTDPEARSWEEVRWACYRKMVPTKKLKEMIGDDEEKLSIIEGNIEETYQLFNSSGGKYGSTVSSREVTMVMEFYFRPCVEYPNGRYYICTKGGNLFEGDLPLGIFPILYCGFDEAGTSARSFSIIKQLRPYQLEVNRAASKIAEHHITLGDDKVLLMNGSKMAPGGEAHGVKAISVTGVEPKIFAGRTGEQYAGYMSGQISEMYMVANVSEDGEENPNNSVDPYNMLFRTAAQKKKFTLYVEKFQEFEEDICRLSLRLAKEYYHDEMLIPVVGKREWVNVEEFRKMDDLSYQIEVEAQSEDLESRMGRQLALNHLIQYAGSRMEGKDLGRVIRSMEYINKEQLFDDDTIDYDNASSDILAMDRGQWVEPDVEENHDYLIKRLLHRKKQRDFQTLDPQIQAMYERKIEMHRGIKAQQIADAQRAKDGFIPTGGFLASVDLYTQDPKDPSKRVRVRLPAESLMWLVKAIEKQGMDQSMLEQADLQTQSRVASLLQQRQGLGAPGQAIPMQAVN